MSDELERSYDVVVIGGGAAGLNGALMLARSRRSVAVIDAGSPRNAPADAVRDLLGHDGIPPHPHSRSAAQKSSSTTLGTAHIGRFGHVRPFMLGRLDNKRRPA